MIKLYSTNCPRCNVLEKKLQQKNIEFEKITDFDVQLLIDAGFKTAPICNVDGEWFNYTDMINKINKM